MRAIDGDALKRRAQKVATESWKMKIEAKVETVLNQFIDWIDEAPTIQAEPHWIPCSEGLPKEEGFYLVTLEDKCGAETTIRFFRIENGEHQWSVWGNEIITAWMPLPEAYHEEVTT